MKSTWVIDGAVTLIISTPKSLNYAPKFMLPSKVYLIISFFSHSHQPCAPQHKALGFLIYQLAQFLNQALIINYKECGHIILFSFCLVYPYISCGFYQAVTPQVLFISMHLRCDKSKQQDQEGRREEWENERGKRQCSCSSGGPTTVRVNVNDSAGGNKCSDVHGGRP